MCFQGRYVFRLLVVYCFRFEFSFRITGRETLRIRNSLSLRQNLHRTNTTEAANKNKRTSKRRQKLQSQRKRLRRSPFWTRRTRTALEQNDSPRKRKQSNETTHERSATNTRQEKRHDQPSRRHRVQSFMGSVLVGQRDPTIKQSKILSMYF